MDLIELMDRIDGLIDGGETDRNQRNGDVETGERRAVTLNTHKRCSIKSLPNHLVIHLKRFDFDFDTMQQTKVG